MTAVTAPTRDAVLAWLGEDHALTDEGVSALVAEAADITRRWPLPDEYVHIRERVDGLWMAYQRIVTAAASSKQEALDVIHSRKRTGVDPWAVA